MMIDLSKFTDAYERKARLYPALICLFPMILSTAISFPAVFSTLSSFVALAITIGLAHFLTHLSRDRGKALEQRLFREWGGMPSVSMFRYRDVSISLPAKLKYHEVLSKISGIHAPTEFLEAEDPTKADEVYLSWSDYLRGKTRNSKKYPLVFKENVNYGFRRNLFGIKPQCILSGAFGFLILFTPALLGNGLNQSMVTVAAILLVYSYVLIFVIKGSWVKVVAEAYGKHLIEAINS